ncbi:MAG TPA: DUF2330 domain-containing protein, partial [bacterium]|nr:DUF2330 domain-containing protein [bacterium]
PVPTFITKEQIHVGDKAVIDHLDAYTAPRLVEYFDENPCEMMKMREMMPMMSAAPAGGADMASRAKSLGVKIEAQYTVGEYDILILSAQESGGLETWLTENGYKIPPGAGPILQSYINQNVKFFVAKVNLKEQSKLGFSYLRPLQVAFESPKFMLPIRLGTVNADGPQDLFIYALSRKGRVETTNYRTVKLPTGMDIPVYVKGEFADFYKSMFSEQVHREDMRALFLEYAWDMNWCDPCAADPLSEGELKELGVFWMGDREPYGMTKSIPPRPVGGARDVFVTRLHVRYDAAHFPEDLVFQETSDRQNFQGRYVLRHPWTGDDSCEEARAYKRELPKRQEREAQQLASLTGWDVNGIRKKMKLDDRPDVPVKKDGKWYKKIWE